MRPIFFLLWICFSLQIARGQNDLNPFHGADVKNRLELNAANPQWAPFFHGVASGDPLEDRVIIWTRVTPESVDRAPIEVNWKIATDPALKNVVRNGRFTTDAERDFTVKIDVTELQAGTTYYYGFTALGRNSLTGKTKTTPTQAQVNHLKFGVVTCSNYQAGYFNVYQRLAERRDLDAIIHLGDYIYEYGQGSYGDSTLAKTRTLEPKTEILSVEDYRTRYSLYRLDTSLIRIHQQHPFITVWDDHESANDSYKDGAENHQANEGNWAERKARAKQVYFEWMPIRDNAARSVYRKLSYGNLMDLFMLDTRLEGRELQIDSIFSPALQDINRTILGAPQKAWLLAELSKSGARWKVIGQQVMFAEFNVGWAALGLNNPAFTFESLEGLFLDIWDGYPAERAQILRHIKQNKINNVVMLTGDLHTAFAYDVPEKPVNRSFIAFPGLGQVPNYQPDTSYNAITGKGSLAVEFMTPSVTSANFDENLGSLPTAQALQRQINTPIVPFPGVSLGNPNPHLKFVDLIQNGHFILDVKPDSVQANYYFSEVLRPINTEKFAEAWYTRNAENHLRKAALASSSKAQLDVPAPAQPPLATSLRDSKLKTSDFSLLGLYPNPFAQTNTLHYSLAKAAQLNISLYSTDGKLVKVLYNDKAAPGVYTTVLDGSTLAAGQYFYKILMNQEVITAKVIIKK